MTRKAYHQLILPNGEKHRMVVVCFTEDGHYLSHYPLEKEECFVEWCGGTLDLRQMEC